MIRFPVRVVFWTLLGGMLAGIFCPAPLMAYQGRRQLGGGGSLLEGLRGATTNEKPFGGRNQGGRNQGGRNQENDRQNNRNSRDFNNGYDNDYDYRPNNSFERTPSFEAKPEPPPKPKPVAAPAVSVRVLTPNKWLREPSYPSRSVINRLRSELEDVAAHQLDLIDDLLESRGIERRSADLLRLTARRTSGDDLLVRDFEKALIERDPDGVATLGELLNLNVADLAHVVLYVSNRKLRDCQDVVLLDEDSRSIRQFHNEAKEFRKRLQQSNLDKPGRDAAIETLDSLVTTIDARAAMLVALENSRLNGGTAPAWNDSEIVKVVIDPRLSPGDLFYIDREFVLAGTRIAGRATIVESMIGAAYGAMAFDAPEAAHEHEKATALGEPGGVTFVNPASNGKAFSFQLNGYDFSLEPGTLQEFSNTDAQKIETFRFAASDGAALTSGFNLVEQNGTPIRKAYFRLKYDGGKWACDRKRTLAMVRGQATTATAQTPVLYIRNATSAFVPYKFGQWDMKLGPSQGQGFASKHLPTETTVVQFTPQPGEKPSRYTLSRGNAYQFVEQDGRIDIIPAQPYQVTIDNESSPFDFAYTLNGEPFLIQEFGTRTHTFKLPPSEVLVTFDAGRDTETGVKCALDKTYFVGIAPGMQLDLFADRSLARRQLHDLRASQIERDAQIASLVTEPTRIAERPAESDRGAVAEDPAPVVPATVPVEPSPRKPQAYVLAVGVSKYADSQYDLKYANRDATEFCDVFRQRAGDFYDRVNVTLLCDEEATSLAVKRALNSIANNAQTGDVVVMFFSSHGFASGRRFYLGTHDLDPKDLLTTAVKHADLVEPLERLTEDKQCQVILFIDTCNSNALAAVLPGEGEKGGAPLRPLNQNGASRDLSNVFSSAGNGCLVFASSASGQASLENPAWKHGAFTKAFLDAVSSPDTDTDGDGIIGVIELDPAMNKIVGDLTDGKQRVYVSWPSTVKNFPLLKLSQ